MARVLIIDEDENSGDFTKRSLESGGHEAVFQSSESGRTVDTLRRSDFDLVLLDVNMPDTDGVDIVKRIRGTADVSLTKVLLYSMMDMDALRAAAARAGHVPCLQKPSTKRDLLRKVDEALEN
jgi:two-component system, chemotaxis family, chemotaxis protein CheY